MAFVPNFSISPSDELATGLFRRASGRSALVRAIASLAATENPLVTHSNHPNGYYPSPFWLGRSLDEIQLNCIRRGVFRGVDELVAAIENYIGHHNEQPKPFIWTAKASDILEKVKRGRAALYKVQSE